MKTDSRVSLDLTDNKALQEYFKSKQPGDEYSLCIRGKVVDNTPDQFVGDVDSVVEETESPAEPKEPEPEVEAPTGIKEAVAKVVGKKK